MKLYNWIVRRPIKGPTRNLSLANIISWSIEVQWMTFKYGFCFCNFIYKGVISICHMVHHTYVKIRIDPFDIMTVFNSLFISSWWRIALECWPSPCLTARSVIIYCGDTYPEDSQHIGPFPSQCILTLGKHCNQHVLYSTTIFSVHACFLRQPHQGKKGKETERNQN